jgi:hypothetical protein
MFRLNQTKARTSECACEIYDLVPEIDKALGASKRLIRKGAPRYCADHAALWPGPLRGLSLLESRTRVHSS